MSIEQQLSLHLAELRYEKIPDEAVTATRKLLLDTVVSMAASLRSPECHKLRDSWIQLGGVGESSLIGSEEKVPASTAALINGAFAHWYEWDDVHIPGILHASAVLFPTLIAAAEAASLGGDEVSGTEFLATVVAAFDVAARSSEALVPVMHNGWMPTGNAVIGAAGGAARLLGLDAAGIHSAMGIAASTMGVSRQPIKDRVNGKNILCGLVAEQAIRAVLLARQGIRGTPDFLFGAFGASALFASDQGSKEKAVAGLGQHFSVMDSSIKYYPCCQSTHGCIDVTLDLLQGSPVSHTEIEAIYLRLPKKNYELVGAPFAFGDDPRVSAQFNVSYTVALALCRGAVRIDDFNSDTVRSAEDVFNLASKVTVTVNDEAAHEVRIFYRDGSIREGKTSIFRGNPKRPLTTAESRQKFDDALLVLEPQSQVNQLYDAIEGAADFNLKTMTKWMRAARTTTS